MSICKQWENTAEKIFQKREKKNRSPEAANFLDWIESRDESFFFYHSNILILVFNLCFKLD